MLKKRTIFAGCVSCLMLIIWGCNREVNSPSSSSAKVSSSATPTQVSKPEPSPTVERASEQAEKTVTQDDKPDPEYASDPDYASLIVLVRNYAENYWKERFIKCDEANDKWFSLEMTENINREPTYLEIRKLRRITTFPFRVSEADKYNKKWHAVSIIKGEALRRCEVKDTSCGEYQGGVILLADLFLPLDAMMNANSVTFGQGHIFALNITAQKGKLTSNEPAKFNYVSPSLCSEIRKHAIWKDF